MGLAEDGAGGDIEGCSKDGGPEETCVLPGSGYTEGRSGGTEEEEVAPGASTEALQGAGIWSTGDWQGRSMEAFLPGHLLGEW